MKTSLAVQAGGGSRRMGENKALKLFMGKPLIQHVIDRLAPMADEILVTANHMEEFAMIHGVRIIPDLHPGCGALGGIHAALSAARNPCVAVVACDLPSASRALFELMCRLMEAEEADVVIPRGADGLEPLHAVYRRETCLPVIDEALERREFKVIGWLSQVRVREITGDELAAIDSARLAFLNLNTPEEFANAERKARELSIHLDQ